MSSDNVACDDFRLHECTAKVGGGIVQAHVDWKTEGAVGGAPGAVAANAAEPPSTAVAVGPELDLAWRGTAAEEAVERFNAAEIAREEEEQARLSAEKRVKEMNESTPSRTDLLALIVRLQEQVGAARDRQDELAGIMQKQRESNAARRTAEASVEDPAQWELQQAQWREQYAQQEAAQRKEWTIVFGEEGAGSPKLRPSRLPKPPVLPPRLAQTNSGVPTIASVPSLTTEVKRSPDPAAAKRMLTPAAADMLSPHSAVPAAGRHRTRYPVGSSPPGGPPALDVDDVKAETSRELLLAREVAKLSEELTMARGKVEAEAAKTRAAINAQRDSEKAAALAARSSSAASKAAEALRVELAAVRTQLSEQMETAKEQNERRTKVLSAEVKGLQAMLKDKQEETGRLHSELRKLSATLDRRELAFARRESEMGAARARAMAMIQAMRKATDKLSIDYSGAHQVLEQHFQGLEAAVME